MMQVRILVPFMLGVMGSQPSVRAVEIGEKLSTPHLEARALELSKMIKCPTCQGQSIEDSRSEMAADLRTFIRARLLAGDTEEEVLSLLKEAYGEAVLFEPSFSHQNLILWLGPFLILFFLLLILTTRALKRRQCSSKD